MMHIVLLEPEIASNTGNIGRTCVAAGASLHLIEPLGFHLDERNLRRAGMDYWKDLRVSRYSTFDQFEQCHPGAELYFATTKGRTLYTEASYGPDSFLVFGKESGGIPEELLMRYPERCVRIPMIGETRSLNLANSVSILLYEALRQNGFEGMKLEGQLHAHRWEDLDDTASGSISGQDERASR